MPLKPAQTPQQLSCYHAYMQYSSRVVGWLGERESSSNGKQSLGRGDDGFTSFILSFYSSINSSRSVYSTADIFCVCFSLSWVFPRLLFLPRAWKLGPACLRRGAGVCLSSIYLCCLFASLNILRCCVVYPIMYRYHPWVCLHVGRLSPTTSHAYDQISDGLYNLQQYQFLARCFFFVENVQRFLALLARGLGTIVG